jgi:hypothetical protein
VPDIHVYGKLIDYGESRGSAGELSLNLKTYRFTSRSFCDRLSDVFQPLN